MHCVIVPFCELVFRERIMIDDYSPVVAITCAPFVYHPFVYHDCLEHVLRIIGLCS